MRKRLLIFIVTGLFTSVASAQVGIGVSGTVDASSQLEVKATNKGFLPPRVALQGTDDATKATPRIANPATGLFVYNTASAGSGSTAVTPGLYYYDGGKWQRVINQQPDATVTFDGTDPNSGATNFSGAQQNTNFVYVSNTDASLWIWNPDASPSAAYVQYTPPASTAWYTSSSITDAGSNKSGSIYRTGNLGIGDFSTAAPANKLVVKSGTANESGLQLFNLTSASPTSGGATLGVDANGNVVTVTGSSFSPNTGTASPSGTVNVAAGTTALLTSVTINQTGTYLISYTMRVQPSAALSNQYAVGYLSYDNVNVAIGTEILGAFPGGSTVGAPGGNYSGTTVLTVNTIPTTIYFRARAEGGTMGFLDDNNGRTRISYVKVTP